MRSRVLILVATMAFALFAFWVRVHPTAIEPPQSVPTQTGQSGPAVTPVLLSTDLPNGPATLEIARAYFDRWGGYAIWDNDVTEFALDTKTPTGRGRQFFEVKRESGTFQLREIASLTRLMLDHGVEVLSAMRFTETTAMRDEFYRTHPDVVPGQFLSVAGGAQPLQPKPPTLREPKITAPAPTIMAPVTWTSPITPVENPTPTPTPTPPRDAEGRPK